MRSTTAHQRIRRTAAILLKLYTLLHGDGWTEASECKQNRIRYFPYVLVMWRIVSGLRLNFHMRLEHYPAIDIVPLTFPVWNGHSYGCKHHRHMFSVDFSCAAQRATYSPILRRSDYFSTMSAIHMDRDCVSVLGTTHERRSRMFFVCRLNNNDNGHASDVCIHIAVESRSRLSYVIRVKIIAAASICPL